MPTPPEQEESRDLGRLLFTVAFVIFILLFLLGSDFAARLFPRAMVLPFILGGWMPFLTYVSALGRQRTCPHRAIPFWTCARFPAAARYIRQRTPVGDALHRMAASRSAPRPRWPICDPRASSG